MCRVELGHCQLFSWSLASLGSAADRHSLAWLGFSLVSSCRMCHPICIFHAGFVPGLASSPRGVLFPSRQSEDGPGDPHCAHAAFTVSYSSLPLPFPEDITFFQCEQSFFVFISKVYLNKNVMFCGRAEGIHSVQVSPFLHQCLKSGKTSESADWCASFRSAWSPFANADRFLRNTIHHSASVPIGQLHQPLLCSAEHLWVFR